MNAKDARRLLEAEGYLELDLPREAWQSLAQVESKDAFEWLSLAGEVHRQLEQYEKALEHLEKAVELHPEDVSLYVNLGWCLKRSDRLADAIEALRNADRICRQRKADTVHSLIMYNLSCYYSLAGDREEMLTWLAAALTEEPGYARMIDSERDFDRFRNDEAFQTLVATFAKKAESN